MLRADEAEEGEDGGQADIAGRGGVAALPLQGVEEGQHRLGAEGIEVEGGRIVLPLGGHEPQEQG